MTPGFEIALAIGLNCWVRTRIWRSRAHFLSTSSGSAATAPFLTQGRWRRESSERRRCRIYDDLARRGGRGSWARTMGKPPELTRGRPGPKYDVRPSAREYEPHKRINQKEDPSDFEHKQDPNHHSGHYTLEACRHKRPSGPPSDNQPVRCDRQINRLLGQDRHQHSCQPRCGRPLILALGFRHGSSGPDGF